MSSDQLRSIFHVDHADLVPNYEIVHLLHQTPIHRVRKRAINTGSDPTNAKGGGFNQLLNTVADGLNHESRHHGKKQLNKNAYFSDVKQNSLGSDDKKEKSYSDKFSLSKNSVKVSVNQMSDRPSTTTIKSASASISLSDGDLEDEQKQAEEESLLDLPRGQHDVSFQAFGQEIKLQLKPTEGLFKNGGPHSLRMWTVKTNPNSTQGLDYEEVVEVSHSKEFSLNCIQLINLTWFC